MIDKAPVPSSMLDALFEVLPAKNFAGSTFCNTFVTWVAYLFAVCRRVGGVAPHEAGGLA